MVREGSVLTLGVNLSQEAGVRGETRRSRQARASLAAVWRDQDSIQSLSCRPSLWTLRFGPFSSPNKPFTPRGQLRLRGRPGRSQPEALCFGAGSSSAQVRASFPDREDRRRGYDRHRRRLAACCPRAHVLFPLRLLQTGQGPEVSDQGEWHPANGSRVSPCPGAERWVRPEGGGWAGVKRQRQVSLGSWLPPLLAWGCELISEC